MATIETYKEIAKDARLTVLDMIYRAQSSHIGSNFSVIDILTVLFSRLGPNDQVILSAGWKAAAFYYFLARSGHFPIDELMTYNQDGSRLIGLTEPGVPGVLFAGGSMQMGLPAAVGFAIAKKIKNEEGKVYCIMSDGELAGGMIWESYLIAHHHKLDNLVIVVDQNDLQAMGKTEDILPAGFPRTFGGGFGYCVADGHDHDELDKVIFKKGETHPRIIYCKTVKGKGVSFMEGNNLYHYKNLTPWEHANAKEELQNG